MDRGHRNFDGQRHGQSYKLRDDGMVPLICPTCQNVFAGKASMPAPPPVTLHGVVFNILVGSENRVGLAAVFPEMILRVACRAVAGVRRGPPSPDGLWRGSLRYEMVAQPGHTAIWRKGWDSNPRYPCRHAGFQDRCLKPLGHPSKPLKLLAT